MEAITLMYHDVYEHESMESGFNTLGARHYKISIENFVEHVKAITEYCNTEGHTKEDVVFTFDDGGISFYTIIAPILEEYGWRGVFFISTKFIGAEGFMTSAQIADLHQRGHVIGSHSHHHYILTEMSLEEVGSELKQSADILSAILGERISTISIPNGCYSDEILDFVVDEGLTTIYTSEPTTKKKTYKRANLIGRYAIAYNTTATDVIRVIKQPSLRARMELKYNILQLVKRVLGSNYSKLKMKVRKYLIK